ncbi:MAG: hypothetical protein HPY76_12885 [Anaerolineae bacterium]|nr:hypothetical protein [Anaerolineae bacterium]
MAKHNWKIAVGVGFILLGGLTLAFNMNLLPVAGRAWELLAGVVFVVAGLVFLGVLAGDREAWWTVFPGFSLLGVGAVIITGALAPRVGNYIGGALVLGSVSLAFWLVFLLRREFWWALIPAGVLLTLAGITLVPATATHGDLTAGLLFLGLAATFLLLLFVPRAQDRQAWAWIPAVILGMLGVGLFFFADARFLNLIFPSALILGGVYLIYRSLQK